MSISSTLLLVCVLFSCTFAQYPTLVYSDGYISPRWTIFDSTSGDQQDYNPAAQAPSSLDYSSTAVSWNPAGPINLYFSCPDNDFFCLDGTHSTGFVSFWVHGGSQGGQNILLGLLGGSGATTVSLAAWLPQGAVANKWTYISVPLSGNFVLSTWNSIFFFSSAASTLYFDKVVFTPVSTGSVRSVASVAYANGLLGNGWSYTENQSPSQINLAAAAPGGGFALSMTVTSGPESLILSCPFESACLDGTGTSNDGSLSFYIHGGSTGGQSVIFGLYMAFGMDTEYITQITYPVATQWSFVSIPLSAFPNYAWGGIVFQTSSSSTFYINDVIFTPHTNTV